MSAARSLSAQQTFSGLRPVQLRRDLGAIADLIEVCFASTLDAGGRSAVHDMRLLSQAGLLTWGMARLSRIPMLTQGFVWVEAGRVIGNVSIMPVGYGGGWMIANVAVYPEYRRQGIARQMMFAALDWIAQRGKFATLQVAADNPAACHLYESLGFETQRIFTRWRRISHLRPPDALPDLPPIRRLNGYDEARLVTLAERVRPDHRGGMGWLRPTLPAHFRLSPMGRVRSWFSGQSVDFWGVPQRADLGGALRVERRIGSLTTIFDLLVDPEQRGTLETPLIHFALRRLITRQQPVLTDHPADDETTGEVLQSFYFKPERTLAHMIRRVPQESP